MSLPKVYMLGSGEIAVPLLGALFDSERLELVGVGTQQDRPAGRGKQLMPTPVGDFAAQMGLEVDKPASVNSNEFVSRLRDLGPDFLFLVSFGQMLKAPLLGVAKSGSVNLHASLLPKYRGASPIQAAILNGDEVTGVSFMLMDEGLDSGPVFSRHEYRISPGQNAAELELELGELGAENVEAVLQGIAAGELKPEPQDHSSATFARKIRKENGRVRWSEPPELALRMLRAYYPWPGVYFEAKVGQEPCHIKITEASVADGVAGSPGAVLGVTKEELLVGCGSAGALAIRRLLPQGRKEMGGAEFARGCRSLEILV